MKQYEFQFCALALLLSLLGVDSARAQEVDTTRFWPLDIGNRWEYTYAEQHWPAGADPADPVVKGYVISEITRDTLINAERHVIFSQQRYSLLNVPDLNPVLESEYSCALRVLDDGIIEFAPDDEEGKCRRWDVLDYQLSLPLTNFEREIRVNINPDRVPYEVKIGGIEYAFEATGWRISGGAMGEYQEVRYAIDLGLFEWLHINPPRLALNGWIYSYKLTFAQIRDESFGTERLVGIESDGELAPLQFSMDDVYPNPAVTHIHTRIRGAVQGTGLIEILDMNGRLVDSKKIYLQHPLTQITSYITDYPAGVYLLRVMVAGGQQASRVFVKM